MLTILHSSGLWMSGVYVRKLRRGKGNSFDKDVLVCDVEAAHAEFPSETIERMFAYKEKVMDVVLNLKPPCDGGKGNDYERHMYSTPE